MFLAHNSTDKAAVARIAEHLRQERIQPWLDRWNLTPGDRWQPKIIEALRSSRACAVFVGPSGLGDWAREELAVAHDRAAKDPEFRLFMVLLPGAPDPMDPSLAFLTTRTWVDLRDGIADKDAFQDLIAAITGVARRQEAEATGEEQICPYRGLAFFDADHAEFFFGREADTSRVLEKLKTSRFVAVIGASGSGKSSLVRAGIVPAVARGALRDSDTWRTRIFTPGARPLSMLAAQLQRLFPGESLGRTLDQLLADTRTLDLTVSAAMADCPPGERTVLVVDQLEEIFTLCGDEHERRAFLDNVLHAATIPGGRVVVVVTMRSDFYHHCASHDQLRALVAAQQYLVGPLGTDQLRLAIEEPARRVGLELEAGLVETILRDVAGRPGTLPLLSHALFELWNARRGRMLTLEAYVANGGVAGALAARANATYEGLSPEHKLIARRVLLRLTQLGEGAADTRRRAAISELVTVPEERSDVESVINALAAERLLTVDTDDVTGAESADVTHEALIRDWPLLRGWINENRDFLRAQRRLSEAAAEWQDSGCEDGLLYRGGRLATWQDRDLSALNELERRFLETSRQHERREKMAGVRRLEWAAVALLVALGLITGVAVTAVRQRNRAAHQRDLAFARQLAASAGTELTSDPQLSLLLALEAYKVAPIAEAEAIVRQATLESNLRRSFVVPGQAFSAKFSPDGSRVAVGTSEGTVHIFEWGVDAAPVTLSGHRGPVRSVAYSPDGRRLASAGLDMTVRIWDLRNGGEPLVLRGHEAAIDGVAFSPDGAHVVTASTDTTVRVWDLANPESPIVLRGHEGPVNSAVFSPDARKIASSGFDGSVRIWDLGGGPTVVMRGHGGLALGVAFSPDGTRVSSGGQDTTARVWDATTGAPLAVLRGHGTTVFGTGFSGDGRLLVTCSGDGTVRIWDWASSGAPQILRGHNGLVYSASFSPDGRLAVSAGGDGRVQIWDATAPGGGVVLRGHQGRAVGTAFSSDGQRVITSGEDGLVRIWNRDRPGEPIVLGGQPGTVNAVAFSHDRTKVAASGTGSAPSRTVRVWDLRHPEAPMELAGHEGPVYDVSFSPDDRRLVSASGDLTLRVWDLTGASEPVVLRGHEFGVLSARFSADGKRVLSAGGDGTVRIWDATGREPATILTGHRGFVFSAQFSPDGRRVVSAGGDGTVRIFDLESGQAPVVITGHKGIVLQASFRPNGDVISAGTDGTVRVTNPGHPGDAISVHGRQENVQDVAFSDDGDWVASAGADGTTVVWKCEVCGPMDEALRLARSRIVRELTPEERAEYLHEQ